MFYASVDLSLRVAAEDLFERFWNMPEHWVEPPNQARGGTSGVICTRFNQQTVYIKKQVGHLYRSVRHPWGRPTAQRELQAFQTLGELGITTPQPLFCESRVVAGQWLTVLVTRALDGFTPLSRLDRLGELDEDRQRALVRAVAASLAHLHRQRWQHSALYPTHIFVKPQRDGFEVALIDLEKLRRRLTVSQASGHDIDQFLRRKRCWDEVRMTQFLEAYQRALAAGGPA